MRIKPRNTSIILGTRFNQILIVGLCLVCDGGSMTLVLTYVYSYLMYIFK
jgi:hypothetical protein